MKTLRKIIAYAVLVPAWTLLITGIALSILATLIEHPEGSAERIKRAWNEYQRIRASQKETEQSVAVEAGEDIKPGFVTIKNGKAYNARQS